MSLSIEEQRQLQEAILSAFPGEVALEQMVKFKLGQKLREIAYGNTCSELVFKLIEYCEAHGKFDDLIKGAYEFNTNNPKLREFYNKYYNIYILPTASPVTPTQISVPAKYEKLQKLLVAGELKEADQETARMMLQVAGREKAGWLDRESIEKFPCEDLRTIDQLWVRYSDGRFGFSVQQDIWLECGGKVDYETECKLGDRIGWRVKGEWIDYDQGIFSLQAPIGHFPFGGWVVFMAGVAGFYRGGNELFGG